MAAMADEQQDPARERHPVAIGLVALVSVAVVVGLIVGGGALAASTVLGLGGNDSGGDSGSAGSEATVGDSLYIPEPSRAEDEEMQGFRLPKVEKTTEPVEEETSEAPADGIVLETSQEAVGAMEQFELRGEYRGGDGASLQVERNTGDGWENFPIDPIWVEAEEFSTPIQSSRTGENKFRLRDTDTGELSNVVEIDIS